VRRSTSASHIGAGATRPSEADPNKFRYSTHARLFWRSRSKPNGDPPWRHSPALLTRASPAGASAAGVARRDPPGVALSLPNAPLSGLSRRRCRAAASSCFSSTLSKALVPLPRGQLPRRHTVAIRDIGGCTAAHQSFEQGGVKILPHPVMESGSTPGVLAPAGAPGLRRDGDGSPPSVYDVIVDRAGTAPFSRCRGSLKAGGRLLLILAGLGDTLQAPWVLLWGDKKAARGARGSREVQADHRSPLSLRPDRRGSPLR
jgi:hypothetical protein